VQTEAPAPEYLPAMQLLQSLALVFASEFENLPAAQLLQSVALVLASEPEYLPAAQSVQTEAPAAEYLPASQSAQGFEIVVLRVSMPARIEIYSRHARTLILMYRAVTGWLKILDVLAVLDHVVGRKKRVVPPAAVAETKFDVVSEYCTSISVTHC
jgi:hypothetical protein